MMLCILWNDSEIASRFNAWVIFLMWPILILNLVAKHYCSKSVLHDSSSYELYFLLMSSGGFKRGLTFGRFAMYESGISISARMVLLIAMAALWIWLAQSRLWRRCFLDFSERPPGGTQGTGSHHFSSLRWTITLRKEPDRVELDDILPCSAYQNSVSWKLSNIS